MEILVDGYNVIHGIPGFLDAGKTSFEAAREELERRLAEYRSRRSGVEVVLYWDAGRGAASAPPKRARGITVVYAAASADAAILERVRSQKSRGRVRVVTDDRGLARAAGSEGAEIVSVERLARWLTDVRDAGDAGKPRPDTGIGKDITEDLKDVWGA